MSVELLWDFPVESVQLLHLATLVRYQFEMIETGFLIEINSF